VPLHDQGTASCGGFYINTALPNGPMCFYTSDTAMAVHLNVRTKSVIKTKNFTATEVPALTCSCQSVNNVPMLNMGDHIWGYEPSYDLWVSISAYAPAGRTVESILLQAAFMFYGYIGLMSDTHYYEPRSEGWIVETSPPQDAQKVTNAAAQTTFVLLMPPALIASRVSALLVTQTENPGTSNVNLIDHIGFQSLMTMDCATTAACTLDVPLDYDALSPNPYQKILDRTDNAPIKTAFDIMSEALANVSLSDGIIFPDGTQITSNTQQPSFAPIGRLLAGAVQRMRPPKQTWVSMRTRNMWALRDGKLYEASRAGFRATLPGFYSKRPLWLTPLAPL
jgi:hypothetical protein